MQILNELQSNLELEGLEEVRLIKDKRTGQSRRFAFAQFVNIASARHFLERYYPTLSVSPDPGGAVTSETTKVRIAYSRDAREKDAKAEDDWKCEVCYLANFAHRVLCFRCNAPRTRATANGVIVAQMSPLSGFATTGDSDASPDGIASQFLLLRGLEPGVNEELLAKGVSKLYKAKAPTPPSEAQVIKKTKISSTTNDASLGAKDGSLKRVLLVRDRKTNDSWRYGFAEFNTVEDAQAAMVKYNTFEKFTISSKPVTISYIHAGVFVPVLHSVGEEFGKFTFSPLSNTTMKLMYWDEAAYASELVMVVTDSKSSKSRDSEHAKLATAAVAEGLISSGKDGEPRLKKRKVEKDSKSVAPHLQFWTNRHAELRGKAPKDTDVNTAISLPATAQNTTVEKFDGLLTKSFADLERKCCLLCSRQFKTETEVNKHERASQLHSDNLKNAQLVSRATAKLTKIAASTVESSAYRDRAKERRQAFNQPKQPAAQHNRVARDPSDELVYSKEAASSLAIPSKGAALLGRMGWTAGEGLGASGKGRTELIKTELYNQGVGLGAQGSKVGDATEEAHRQTKNTYADFVSDVKDKAKERFESLS